VFEAAPTKLVHYPLPLYGALAWLMALALAAPLGRGARIAGAALTLATGAAFAAAGPLIMTRLGDWNAAGWAILAGALFLAAALAGAALLVKARARAALAAAILLGTAAHGVLAGGLAPALRPLWLSSRAARALSTVGMSPRQGIDPGPVTVAGYEEPSLIFLLGTATALGGAQDAATAIAQGRPAIVEGRLDGAFRSALVRAGRGALRVGEGGGLDYSNNRHDILRIYRPLPTAPAG
ncbi:MAG: ArnT family glycosyltransferase, partial [Caulobacteraceae bacterium]